MTDRPDLFEDLELFADTASRAESCSCSGVVVESTAQGRSGGFDVDFRILGRLEVVGAAGELELRGAKRRGLVALLAAHVGEWRSLDEIVEDLWGPEAPSGAARTVQTYVSQMRRAFAEPDVAIAGRDGGYTLDVDPTSVDARRFEQLVRQGSGAQDPRARVDALRAALALWRGRPLAEFDGAWATDERTRLELLHLHATERLVAAQLDLGAAAEVVPELERLVDAHPLDERFWAQLLLAYYRVGRQADALRAFQRARSTLAAELGIEPGPELVALEQRILDQDDGLQLPAPPTTGPADLPTGTITFLFTDIADSTRLWEVRPHEMATTVASHDATLLEVVEGHGGRVVKSTGDGQLAVFGDADDAVGAAVAAQHRINAAGWPVPIEVRMGLHTGTAAPLDGDYHAPAVNRAARVAGVAHPGQVLVSEATAVLAEQAALRDLGEHRLRGLAPMRLFQVVADGLRREFPPTSASTTVGLPEPQTSFVGRDAELGRLTTLLVDHRLVTLTGVGGCGKTRLAIETARKVANEFMDGVRFVDLAAATDAASVDTAVSDALGLTSSLGSGIDARQRVATYLADRNVLVLLDNCEHLLETCADLTEAVLSRPGTSRLLATSREPLGLLDEQVMVLPSLDVGSDAVHLFVDRARAVTPAGALVDDRASIVQICRRLDGIPLAIELAAAHTSVLSPAQILERLDARFLELTGGHRRIQRQQTLAAALDWSWDLLDEGDRIALARLAAFPAGFPLDAAEAVVARPDVVERLRSLHTKSLLHVSAPPDTSRRRHPRYRLLETVRLYAEQKLVLVDDALAARTRHRDWVRSWIGSISFEERWLGDEDVLVERLPDVRAAIEWSLSMGEPDEAASIATGVDWSRREASAEAEAWCERLLEDPALPAELEARLHLTLWWVGPVSAQRSTMRHAMRALELTKDAGGPLEALACIAVARDHIIPAVSDRDEERMRLASSLGTRAVELGASCPPAWQLYTRMWAGMVEASFLNVDRALEHFTAGAALPDEAPFRELHASVRGYLAIARLVTGDAAGAASLARSAYAPEGLQRYWQHARAMSFVALGGDGDVAAAELALRDYQAESTTIDWAYARHSVVLLAGVLAALREDWANAAILLSAGAVGARRTPADYLLYITFRDRVRGVLGSERSRELRAEGRALTVDQAMALAFPEAHPPLR